MNKAYPRLIAAALAFVSVAPALAQPMGEPGHGLEGRRHSGLFAALSPEGRQILKAAHQSAHSDGTREQIKAARAQILTLLDADTLDVGALDRAMVTERNLVLVQQQRMHAAMLAAYQKLGAADRHAFVAATRAIEVRVDQARAAHRVVEPPPPM